MKQADKGCFHKVFYRMSATEGRDALPSHDKREFAKMTTDRRAAVGFPVVNVREDGNIDWPKEGWYALQGDNENDNSYVSVKNRLSQTVHLQPAGSGWVQGMRAACRALHFLVIVAFVWAAGWEGDGRFGARACMARGRAARIPRPSCFHLPSQFLFNRRFSCSRHT